MARSSIDGTRASAFARALRQLLDDTGFFTRAEWASLLGVSAPALSQWANDRTVPRADLLRMIVDIVRTRGGPVAGEALMALEGIIDEPAASISPIGARFGSTLRSYLAPRPLSEVGLSLRGLSPQEQLALLGRDDGLEDAPTIASNPDLPIGGDVGHWRMPRMVRTGTSGEASGPVGLEELARCRHALIQGSPGSGKSTMLLMIARSVRKGEDVQMARPRDLAGWDLQAFLDTFARESGPRLLLVDGIDEVDADQRTAVVEFLSGAAERAPRLRIFATSRPVGELERLSSFEQFTIAPMSDVDVLAGIPRPGSTDVTLAEVDRFLCHMTERESLRHAMRDHLMFHCAWTLFERNAVTPFAETAVLHECARVLIERDVAKGLNRVREPWASYNSLISLVGEVSFRMVETQLETFNAEAFGEWLGERVPEVPADRLLDLLLVQGLLVQDAHGFSFPYRVLRDYFAARFVIESARDAAEFFEALPDRPELRSVMRMACSLATDATPLLLSVMNDDGDGGPDVPLLADLLAQPLRATPDTLAEGCRELVSWLDHRTSHWRPMDRHCDDALDAAQTRWVACARIGRRTDIEIVARTLRAVHLARSGPAYHPLKAELASAKSSFLLIFSQALDVEGRLQVRYGSGHAPKGAAQVVVENLHLS